MRGGPPKQTNQLNRGPPAKTAVTSTVPTTNSAATRTTDARHIPREFKYLFDNQITILEEIANMLHTS